MSRVILLLSELLNDQVVKQKIQKNFVDGMNYAAKKHPDIVANIIQFYQGKVKVGGYLYLLKILGENPKLIICCMNGELAAYLLRKSLYTDIPLDLLIEDTINYYKYDCAYKHYISQCLQVICNNTARANGGNEVKKSLSDIYDSYSKAESEDVIQNTYDTLKDLGLDFGN